MKKKLQPYKKTVVAAAGAALVGFLTVLDESGQFDQAPWFSIVVALATAAGVYRVRNQPK